MKNNIKDSYSKQLVQLLSENYVDLDSKNVLILVLLNALLVPTSKSYQIDKITGRRRLAKTSIVDAQKSFLLNTHTINDLYNQIQKEIENCYSLKQTLQPIVCIVGTEYVSIKEYQQITPRKR
ncbi:unnamed protein product [Macrosiphum euphorbiae]|uniref:Uncharacterized protein n=1 Tax=Macrosiphum euphorbiae TaxID=13131 RepID=A0AAV0WHL8_9HEMI|nr:unnamed protein product [Macrosiphum euphorbiae]